MENQNIEWKISWRDEYIKWICGFANANGGKLEIGKDDNGKLVGIDNSKELMENLPNETRVERSSFEQIPFAKARKEMG